MTITVYSKLVCPQCDSTYRALLAAGIEPEMLQSELSEFTFNVVVVDHDSEALEHIKELGYLQAPVLVIETAEDGIEHWSGFRPDKIDEIKARLGIVARVDSAIAGNKFKELKEFLKTEAVALVAA